MPSSTSSATIANKVEDSLFPAEITLSNSKTFTCCSFGYAKSNVCGEAVFQTGMVGYVESLTDPSYFGQILVLTYPLIGNYGVPDIGEHDEFGLPMWLQSSKIQPCALVISDHCYYFSNVSAFMSLQDWLKQERVVGLCGLDTRALTKELREHGTMKATINVHAHDSEYQKESELDHIQPRHIWPSLVCTHTSPTVYNASGEPHIAVLDCGIKYNQIRCLCQRGAKVTVLPWNSSIDDNIYDALFLSSGPGDPVDCEETILNVRSWISKSKLKPLFGICLGHQILALALGLKTYKMKYGNRGHNQPCLHDASGRCFITSQNHGYAVDINSAEGGKDWIELFRNANDGSNEGIIHKALPFMSVQFHPEHCAGPVDLEILFSIFLNYVTEFKSGNTSTTLCDFVNSALAYTQRPHELSIAKLYKNQQAIRKVVVLGSGGLSIGQAGEFDYSGSQALKALREENVKTILINPNIATIQTTVGMADRIYSVPVNEEYVTSVIASERPDGILLAFGGQTALNCGVKLHDKEILKEFGVKVLGTPIEAIQSTEDRVLFAKKIEEIGEKVAPSAAAHTIEEALCVARQIGYPVLVRAAYALGGLGSGFAESDDELRRLCSATFAHTKQVLIDKSLLGWKELEYEVVRDVYGNCITVCNMENVDALGVHTGESIVVSPSQTLTNGEYQMLRSCAIKVVNHLGIVGECNIQYALDPNSSTYYIIEVNARLSRSSALASKATGYPLAYVAAKVALGIPLPQLKNSVTRVTTACFEPSLDYCVVKIPRWDLRKFNKVNRNIGSSMKSVGEVMAIGRNFEEAFQKALRMTDQSISGFDPFVEGSVCDRDLSRPTDRRIFYIATAFKNGYTVEKVHQLTHIDKWFLYKLQSLIRVRKELSEITNKSEIAYEVMVKAKRLGFCDKQIAAIVGSSEMAIRQCRHSMGVLPAVRQIDTVAAEWPCFTNYLYLTYDYGSAVLHDIAFKGGSTIVLGSGVYRIGSSVEFDWCAVRCVQELRKMNKTTVMINCNPETVSTDYDVCDRLYFEEISLETVLDICELENPLGVIVSMGGQLPNNISVQLSRQGVSIIGTTAMQIDNAENRYKFSRMLDGIEISQPAWREATDIDSVVKFSNQVGLPCLIRPSYVLSGAAMNVVYNEEELEKYLMEATEVNREHPVVISKFIRDAKEIDVDAVACSGVIWAWAVSEHVENAGIHSGDATLVTPPQDLNEETLSKIEIIVRKVAAHLEVSGPFNMQLIAKDNELKVIECNLRVSRSFPFASKSLGFDMITAATYAMIKAKDAPDVMPDEICALCVNGSVNNVILGNNLLAGSSLKVAVKVPVFSFSRLDGADVVLGVEMASTGEIACFGSNIYDAYLKALESVGYCLPVIPKVEKQKKEKVNCNGALNGAVEMDNGHCYKVLLSVGNFKDKSALLPFVRIIEGMGYRLYGTFGSADFYQENGINITEIDFEGRFGSRENANSLGQPHRHECFFKIVSQFCLVINLSKEGSCVRRASNGHSTGYKIRRAAVTYNIPLLSNVKTAKLFIQALQMRQSAVSGGTRIILDTNLDCLSNQRIHRFPGLIDIHVHCREPGSEYKEDWTSVTRAALAGGITTIFAMPNTSVPIVDEKALMLTRQLSKEKACCDYAHFIAANTENMDKTASLCKDAIGLKMYLNTTFNAISMGTIDCWLQHFESFPKNRVICTHAEGQTLAAVLMLAQLTSRHVHVCHISKAVEMEMIKRAREVGINVTCEVCPHHLFPVTISEDSNWARVKPPLNTAKDEEYLWQNLDHIDCFATDHAPHTAKEKDAGLYGFPGLETMLPLLLDAVNDGRLTLEDIEAKLSTNPRKIFSLPKSSDDTWVEVDLNHTSTISAPFYTKCNWSPFEGRNVKGAVRRVMLRGKLVVVDGTVLAEPGIGMEVSPALEQQVKQVTLNAPVVQVRSSRERSLSENFEVQKEAISSHATGKQALLLPAGLVLSDTRSADTLFHPHISAKHFLSVQKTTKSMLHHLFNVALSMRSAVEKNRSLRHVCQGKVLGLLFFEASTRTNLSFSAAIQRLGGSVLNFEEASSSFSKKNESLADTVRVLGSYCDCLVMRHPLPNAVSQAATFSPVPLINAGDGIGEHPTQALLDVFTIREEIGTVNNLTITLVGDLKNGRTVHSLARLLCLYKVRLFYVPYSSTMRMPQNVLDYVAAHGIYQEHFNSLDAVLPDTDVLYMTRIQAERGNVSKDARSTQFVVTPELMTKAKSSMIVMHPLPRCGEIDPTFDLDPRAAYFRQADNGMFVRMALLAVLLSRLD